MFNDKHPAKMFIVKHSTKPAGGLVPGKGKAMNKYLITVDLPFSFDGTGTGPTDLRAVERGTFHNNYVSPLPYRILFKISTDIAPGSIKQGDLLFSTRYAERGVEGLCLPENVGKVHMILYFDGVRHAGQHIDEDAKAITLSELINGAPRADKVGGGRRGMSRKRVFDEPLTRSTVTLPKSDFEYLKSIDSNLSKAVRALIAENKELKGKGASND